MSTGASRDVGGDVSVGLRRAEFSAALAAGDPCIRLASCIWPVRCGDAVNTHARHDELITISTACEAPAAHRGGMGPLLLLLTPLGTNACAPCVRDGERETEGRRADSAHARAEAKVTKEAVATCVSHVRSAVAPVATRRALRWGVHAPASCSVSAEKFVMSASAELSFENIPARDAAVSSAPRAPVRKRALFDAAIILTIPHSLDTPNCGTPYPS